ncbi:pleckstrin homology domain-containing family G member 4B isoform X1 [Lepisosteus oculatus]|uniref:pleckstrin homology domain-containing family G member 4B isoform X1 n=1 Tax=Lepisosteus oculatus TaxID=7918 RepID=UPI0035F52764
MNPDSLDSSIQGALSALYPPFEATAPTVLSQLFRVIEERYQGDALQCLLDFLIPAKHILESVQQAACAVFSDVLFRCEGWPLCLRERVVVQLAPLNPFLLRPGDFYLQVEPFGDQAARIVLKSLLEDFREVEETPVPETSYPSIFTEEWLREVNQGRHGTPLRTCLLSTDQGIVKVPWEQVANPEFVDKPKAMASSPISPGPPPPSAPPSSFSVETRILPAKDGIAVSLHLIDSSCTRLIKVDQSKPPSKPIGWVSPNTWDSRNPELEGDYVDLVEFNKEKTSRTPQRTKPDPSSLEAPRPPPSANVNLMPCGRTLRFAEEPCTPCLRRKLGRESELQELRCRYRESYLAALQNPVSFEQGGFAEILEEAARGLDSVCQRVSPSQTPQCCHEEHLYQVAKDVSGSSMICREVGEVKPKHCCTAQHSGTDSSKNKGKPVPPPPAPELLGKCSVGQRVGAAGSPGVYTEMTPSVQVVHCKKTTAFGLLSPKVERRKSGKKVSPQDASQTCKAETEGPALLDNGPEKAAHSSPAEKHVRPLPQPGSSRASSLMLPSAQFSSHLLHLGIACLPGSRDRTGRAVLEVFADHNGWKSPLVSSQELCKLLLYFHSIPRKEVRDLGMTLVIDARKKTPPPALIQALMMVQEQVLHAVHCVLMLVDKETGPRTERHPGLQVEVMTSLKALHKIVEGSQLTSDLEGTFPYSHSDWLKLYQKLGPFMVDLQEASSLLQKAISKFDGNKKIDTVQEVQQGIQGQKTMMKEVLEDTRLVALQREGGAMLARLRKEEARFACSEDYRDAMSTTTNFYNQVEEQVHTLVMKSNESLQHLDFLLKLRELEGRFKKIRDWFDADGERRLLEADSVEDSLERVEQTLHNFNSFLEQATEQKNRALALVTEAGNIEASSYPEKEIFRTMVFTFKSSLADFLSRAEQCRIELEIMVNLYRFCEKATELAKGCRQYLEQAGPGSCVAKEHLSTLEKYKEKFTTFSAAQFQEVKAQACTLKGSRGMRVWNVAWLKCQEVRQQLEERLQESEKAQRPAVVVSGPRRLVPEETAFLLPSPSEGPARGNHTPARTTAELPGSRDYQAKGNDFATVMCFNLNFKPDSKSCKGLKAAPASKTEASVPQSVEDKEENSQEFLSTQEKSPDFPRGDSSSHEQLSRQQQALGRSLSEGSGVCSSPSEPLVSPTARSCGQPSRKILQAAWEFQMSRHGSFCSEESYCLSSQDSDNLGTGLEAPASGPGGHRAQGGTPVPTANSEENGSNVLKLQRIVEELLLTEREYVRSLSYIITHYFPQLERPDVPQDLRGQRGRIFGNLEKLHDFHRHFFLKELEGCLREPLRVARCFLRHRESFGLYALYSKNKPQSDSLIIHHGHAFFKQKQLELGDKMDLWSYLLKPVQRISKYNLLLQDMEKECGPQQGRERSEIQAALEVIRFQLRHGNDLLAMDDIQDCDVNLKEQGQLIRQNEFLVSFRKKKCFRHVFLFQDLILFSKTKKTEVGNDMYLYKQSFKTSDIGMTRNSGDSGLCFEIWFRRRKSQDTYVLQAESPEVKEAWTTDLERILWDQAVRNREIRMQERVFMGIGSKPFMDIKPSAAAICDRAVNCVYSGRESKAMSSITVPATHGGLLSMRPNSIDSGSSTSSSGSHSSSSSSGRGSLPPHRYLPGQQRRGEMGQGAFLVTGVLEEDDLDNETENLHLLMDSSESSGESISGFSSSDHSCLSVIGGEPDDSSSFSSLFSKPSSAHESLPEFRRRTSPVVSRSRPSRTPPPQAKSMGHPGKVGYCSTTVDSLIENHEKMVIGRSTEV